MFPSVGVSGEWRVLHQIILQETREKRPTVSENERGETNSSTFTVIYLYSTCIGDNTPREHAVFILIKVK